MEHVTPIQICAVTRSTVDGHDAILRLAVSHPGVPHVDVIVGTAYPDALQAIAAVILHAATRLRPQTIGNVGETPPERALTGQTPDWRG